MGLFDFEPEPDSRTATRSSQRRPRHCEAR